MTGGSGERPGARPPQQDPSSDPGARVPPVVVVGASAGGVPALTQLVAGLPVGLPAAVLVVLHVSATGPSVLPEILQRSGPLAARHAADGESLRPGEIRIAPPDHHLAVGGGCCRIGRGPKEYGHRPSIDTLFRSAARSHGRAVVGVVLSGTRDDGTLGAHEIRAAGGTTIAQDPAEALFDSMPRSAIESGAIDEVLPVSAIAGRVQQLARGSIETGLAVSGSRSVPAGEDDAAANPVDAQSDALDQALWAGYRALRDQADLCRRMARRSTTGPDRRRTLYALRAEEADRRADTLYALLTTPA